MPAFFARENPISRNAKPACMNITSRAATMTQIELIASAVGQLSGVRRLQRVRVRHSGKQGICQRPSEQRRAGPSHEILLFGTITGMVVR